MVVVVYSDKELPEVVDDGDSWRERERWSIYQPFHRSGRLANPIM